METDIQHIKQKLDHAEKSTEKHFEEQRNNWTKLSEELNERDAKFRTLIKDKDSEYKENFSPMSAWRVLVWGGRILGGSVVATAIVIIINGG